MQGGGQASWGRQSKAGKQDKAGKQASTQACTHASKSASKQARKKNEWQAIQAGRQEGNQGIQVSKQGEERQSIHCTKAHHAQDMLLMGCCCLCVGAGGLVVPCPMLPLVHNFPVRTQKDVRVRSKYKRAAPKPPNVQRCQSWPPPKAAAFRRWRGGCKATARLQELPVFLAGCIAPHKQTPQGSQNPALPESIPGSVLSFFAVVALQGQPPPWLVRL